MTEPQGTLADAKVSDVILTVGTPAPAAAAAMRDAGERPAWTVVDPWPGVIAGVCATAFGVLILAIRRLERKDRT